MLHVAKVSEKLWCTSYETYYMEISCPLFLSIKPDGNKTKSILLAIVEFSDIFVGSRYSSKRRHALGLVSMKYIESNIK